MSDKQSVTLAPGYLLHARPFRDSSQIADFFTRDHGRVSLVARGARRPKSRLKGQLRPFQRVFVSWVTRGSLGTLTTLETDVRETARVPRRVLSAYYVNELIMRALRPGDVQADVFQRYEALLAALDEGDEAVTLRVFERDLLECLGYGLQLRETQQGAPVQPELSYHLDLMEGPRAVVPGSHSVSGQSLIDLANGELPTPQSQRDAKQLLRFALEQHLGTADSRVRQVLVAMQSRRREWQSPQSDQESGE